MRPCLAFGAQERLKKSRAFNIPGRHWLGAALTGVLMPVLVQ
jgi:hypothetical protein